MAGRIPCLKVIHLLLLSFLMVPFLLLLTLQRTRMDPLSLLNLQVSTRASLEFKVLEESTRIIDEGDGEMAGKAIALRSETAAAAAGGGGGGNEESALHSLIQEQSNNNTEVNTEDLAANKELEQHRHVADIVTDDTVSKTTIACDFSQRRTDTCVLHGDVRILPSSSSVVLVRTPHDTLPENAAYSLRPYARKWETPVMELIRPISIGAVSAAQECGVHHAVPVVVFSTGGFAGKNFFHDFSDVLIPLFITSFHYRGRVQFLITNFNRRWVGKYAVILSRMSDYEVINLDGDERVHCSGKAHVGLMSHSELVIDPARTPGNYSMADFRELLRSSLSLKRRSIGEGKNYYSKPRLLLMLRKGSRELTNKREVVALTRKLGFKVIVAGPEQTKNLSRFAGVVNSCAVMMGVHGAGLTNMIFLPEKATLVQIIPWGGLRYACNHDYGDPTAAMGIRYLEYEVGREESSLVKQYPKDHPVFTDPESVHRQGWNAIWAVFLNRQSIKLDVKRFKGVLQEAMRSFLSR
ncbi:alpha-1,3-arabinosyltransferase XAT3-like isoform X2 [Zingiber officinale]|uniref:alpha-1,3-arabinosyltransferase XAT3-like isoform X2 n=1 Tax=Zingiber officinale TaxID=94328 RepID=UPI001C4CDA20|nr:alpha-1,3-arabinosyltransferase XAT3-like isoform X2 [Zingiber officinale]